VEAIRLVQDTLTPHTPGAFDETLPPVQAFALAQRFEPHYTPKKGAWLQRAAIACAALSQPCLDRRMAGVESVRSEVLAWAANRNRHHKPVHWTFSQGQARSTFQSHDANVQKFN
jgi:hypothetical protein